MSTFGYTKSEAFLIELMNMYSIIRNHPEDIKVIFTSQRKKTPYAELITEKPVVFYSLLNDWFSSSRCAAAPFCIVNASIDPYLRAGLSDSIFAAAVIYRSIESTPISESKSPVTADLALAFNGYNLAKKVYMLYERNVLQHGSGYCIMPYESRKAPRLNHRLYVSQLPSDYFYDLPPIDQSLEQLFWMMYG